MFKLEITDQASPLVLSSFAVALQLIAEKNTVSEPTEPTEPTAPLENAAEIATIETQELSSAIIETIAPKKQETAPPAAAGASDARLLRVQVRVQRQWSGSGSQLGPLRTYQGGASGVGVCCRAHPVHARNSSSGCAQTKSG